MSFDLQVNDRTLRIFAENLGRVPETLWVKAMDVFLERVTAALQASWAGKLGRSPFPHFTGAAAASLQRTRRARWAGGHIDFQGKVFSPLVHVAVLEGGRQPGTFPALDALTRWVQLRADRGQIQVDVDSLAPRSRRTDAGLVPMGGSERKLRAYRSLAFLIGRSIKRRGQTPRRYARKTLAQNRRMITKEATIMAQELARAITKRGGR